MLEKRVGSIDLAREKFKMCLKVNPKNAKVYQAWGVLEASEDNIALATELFRAGLEQKPDNTYIMQVRAHRPANMCVSRSGVTQSLTRLASRCWGRHGATLDGFWLVSRGVKDTSKTEKKKEKKKNGPRVHPPPV